MALSVEAGRPVECDRCGTFADGLAVRVAVPLAVEELVRAAARRSCRSPSARSREAVGAFAAAGIRVEGSSGAALAALGEVELPDGPVVLIVTGRNIDDDLHRRAVEAAAELPGLARLRASVSSSASIRSGRAAWAASGSSGALIVLPFFLSLTTRSRRLR